MALTGFNVKLLPTHVQQSDFWGSYRWCLMLTTHFIKAITSLAKGDSIVS